MKTLQEIEDETAEETRIKRRVDELEERFWDQYRGPLLLLSSHAREAVRLGIEYAVRKRNE